MTRISLKEAYDNKDVIAQIYAIRDTAESAVDTSEQAVTTANTASEHVDALVPQVEQAVENANSASASAQTSAQTVAGYENRLTVAEGAIDELESDVNDVTLRVTTAEGDIVTIQGRVTALETADGQNVKLTGEHAIGDYAVLLTGNQNVKGLKSGRFAMKETTVSIPQPETSGQYRLIYTIKNVAINTAVSGHIQVTSNLNYGYYGEFVALVGQSEVWGGVSGISFGNYVGAVIFFGYDGADLDIWVKDQSYRPKQIKIENVSTYGNLLQPEIVSDGVTVTADYTTHKNYTVTGGIGQ